MRLTRVVRRFFDAPSPTAIDPRRRAELRAYLADLAAPYDAPVRDELIEGGAGHAYGEMVERLIAEALTDGEKVDVVVVAFATPDVRAGRAATTYRGDVCPGDPLAFAVCDQGAAAGFTGLRLLRAFEHAGECGSALLVVVEQPAVHVGTRNAARLPRRSAGVALLCGGRGAVRLAGERIHVDVPPRTANDVFRAELAALCPAGGSVLVLGDGLAGHHPPESGARPVLAASPDQPYTGVWWELAGQLDGGRSAGSGKPPARIVLADYDPALGYLCLALFAADEREQIGHP